FFPEILIALAIVVVPTVLTALFLFRAPESTARKVSTWAGALGLLAFMGFYGAVAYLDRPTALGWVLSVLWPNMNTLVLMPIFAIGTAWMGTRRPYSSYEYLLNECYQCGKCHTGCPVTKVADDALGGLNLVYNTFKNQHDGVPLWTCLPCEACSAVCPSDIQYIDYILDRSFMKCCGHDQLWQGKVDVFERMRDYNTKIIKMLGVKTFITSCAEGYRTFKLDYKLDGVRVVHITQFLYERGLRIPPQAETAKKIRVAFQDPCRSGRQMPIEPVFEEPRELIKRVDNAELVELKTFREAATDSRGPDDARGPAGYVLPERPADEHPAREGPLQAGLQGPDAGVHPRPRDPGDRGRRNLHGLHPLLRQLRLRSDRDGRPQ